jgi:ferredoxin
MKVTVDQDKWVSSGPCVLTAGDVFDQRDADGVLINESPASERQETAPAAAVACPAKAIEIEE